MGVCDEALGVTPGRTTSSADLGGKLPSLFIFHPHPQMGRKGVGEVRTRELWTLQKMQSYTIEVNNCSGGH